MDFILTLLFIILAVPISLAGSIALFSALMLLLPEPIEQARANLDLHPWRSIFLGALNLVGALVIAALLMTLSNNFYDLQGVAQGLVMLIALVLAVAALIGLCAMILLTGARIGQARSPFMTNLRGGGLLLLACATPFVGWFVFTPLLVCACVGSVVGIYKPRKKSAPEEPAPEQVVLEETAVIK